METEILELLKIHPIQNLPVKGFFENYPLEDSVVFGQSAILTGTSDYCWAYLAVNDPADFNPLLERFDFASLYFANVEDWMLPELTRIHHIEWKLSTLRYYLPEDQQVDPPLLSCKPLSQAEVSYVFQYSPYKDFTSEAYIAQRLEWDISAGAWIDDRLIGWGLTHDDGSLGFLNVISGFRGQGVGENVFRAMIQLKRQQKKPVFVNVEAHNQQSRGLLRKLGFVEDRQVSWVKLSAGTLQD